MTQRTFRNDNRWNVGAKRNSGWHGARKGMSKGACKTRETGGDKREILNEGEIL